MPILRGLDLRLGVTGFSGSEAFNVSIPKGSITVVVGPNGSGKSLFLRTLLGENFLFSGNVYGGPDPEPIAKWPVNQLSNFISFVPQEQNYNPFLSVRAFLEIPLLAKRGFLASITSEDIAHVNELLFQAGLQECALKRISQISSGERQRVFLLRGLLQNAPILILDEPTNHLDPAAVHLFWKTLLQLKEKNRTVVLSTHDLEQTKKNAQHLLAFLKGNLFYEGKAETFFLKGRDRELFGF